VDNLIGKKGCAIPTNFSCRSKYGAPRARPKPSSEGLRRRSRARAHSSPCFDKILTKRQASPHPRPTPTNSTAALLDSTIQYQETSTPLPLSLLLPLYIIFRHQNNMNVNNNQKKAPPPAGNMGLANKTVEGDGTSTKYLDKYLTIYDQWPGVNKLADVKEEHVEDEWLRMFWLNFAYWMAITPLKKEIGEGYLDFSSKETYYKSAKRVLSIKFPNNDFSSKQQDSTDWHKVTKAYFDTECKRSRIENEVEKETRKSEPLYKDLSSSLTVERAKYLGVDRVDAKSIASSLIQKAKHYDSASRLAEFNLNRAALARGGEHSYAR